MGLVQNIKKLHHILKARQHIKMLLATQLKNFKLGMLLSICFSINSNTNFLRGISLHSASGY